MLLTRTIVRIATVACAVTVLAGCAGHARVDMTQAQPQEQEENVVQETRPADHDFQSAQKEVQITLPDDWRVQPNPNTPSLLHVAAPDQSKSINISRTRRSDMISKSTLTDYMTLHKKGVNAIVDSNGAGEKVLRTDSISIDQYSAYLKETEVDYGKNHFGYISAYFESEHHFYVVALGSEYAITDEDRALFEEAAHLVRILDDTPTDIDSVKPSSTLTAHEGNDGAFQISLPSNWKSDTSPMQDDLFGLSNNPNEELMMIARYPKDQLPASVTLEIFYKAISKNDLAQHNLSPLPAPVPVEIGGFKGLQVEMHTAPTTMKYGELHTFLDTPDYFVRIVFSTKESRFKRVKPDYVKYTQTYQENL